MNRNKEIPAPTDIGRKLQLDAVKAHGLTPAQMDQLKSAKFPILAIGADQVCFLLFSLSLNNSNMQNFLFWQ